MKFKFKFEPVMITQAIAIAAVVLTQFGINVSEDQKTAIVSGILALAAVFMRSRVTPVARLEYNAEKELYGDCGASR